MTPSARVQTAIEILDAILLAARSNGAAADSVIAQEFRARRYAGSKDKRAIRDLVYRAIRGFGAPPISGRAAMLGLKDETISAEFGAGGYGPAAIAEDEPKAEPTLVADWLRAEFLPMVDETEQAGLLGRAPFDLRVNRLKADIASMQAELGGETVPHIPDALRFSEGFDIASHPAYLDGKVEVQDAGSQLIARVCRAAPGMTIVDFCAGAGGKTLALAAEMNGQGRLIACDTDRTRLQRLPERAERAGAVVESRLLNPKREHEMLEDLEATADIVLVDAPCSGSGTWRRNPELRWRLTPERLDRLTQLQAQVLDAAMPLVRPGGSLAYAVCSLFAREGAGQIDAFLARHAGWSADLLTLPLGRISGKGCVLTPLHDATDGFFIARLTRSC